MAWKDGHPGFNRVAESIAKKEKIPLAQAKADLAAGTRRAGKQARQENPRLDRVKGRPKPAQKRGR